MSQSSEFIRAVLAGWWVSPFVGGGVVGEVFELVWQRGWEGRGTRRRRMTGWQVACLVESCVGCSWVVRWRDAVEESERVNEISKNNNNNQLQLSSNNNNQLLMHALTQADGDGFG